jgi:hypothetical protein
MRGASKSLAGLLAIVGRWAAGRARDDVQEGVERDRVGRPRQVRRAGRGDEHAGVHRALGVYRSEPGVDAPRWLALIMDQCRTGARSNTPERLASRDTR